MKVIVIAAQKGGVGKTTIARQLLGRRNDVGYSISCTTRSPRNGERDGTDYYFLTKDQFLARREAGDFAESAQVHGNLYGTLKSEIARVLGSGKHVIMDIDVQGASQIRRAFPQAVTVFVLPPSAETLFGILPSMLSERPKAMIRPSLSSTIPAWIPAIQARASSAPASASRAAVRLWTVRAVLASSTVDRRDLATARQTIATGP